jgi:hypothetical protein
MAVQLTARNSAAGSKADSCGDAIRAQVAELLRSLYPQLGVVERRKYHRYPYPQIVHLTPIDEAGEGLPDETTTVVCKHLSERGLGFFHQQPLAHRRVIASLESPHMRWLAFVLDVGWCRFTRHSWYESGGRFLQTVTSPLNAPARAVRQAVLVAEAASTDRIAHATR